MIQTSSVKGLHIIKIKLLQYCFAYKLATPIPDKFIKITYFVAKSIDMFAKTDYNMAMDCVKKQASLTSKGNTLAMSNESVKINAYSNVHRLYQLILYLKKDPLSISKLNQEFNRYSTYNLAFERYILSLDLLPADESFGHLIGSSEKMSRAWWMISFWVATSFWVSSNPAHELHEFPRKFFIHVWRLHRFTLISIFRRGEPPCSPVSPCFPFSPCARFFRTQFITLFQSPKPAQGMIHTLSLAPLGFRLIVQSKIYGRFGTGDTLHAPALSPVPQRLYLLLFPAEHLSVSCCRLNEINLKPPILEPTVGAYRLHPPAVSLEAAMIKKLRLSLDIEVTVTEMITPDLIDKAITVTNDGKHVHIDQEMLDMLQEIIHYISRHDKYHGDCLSGELYSMLTEHECDKVLRNHLNKKSFEQIILDAAAGMSPEYEVFIKQLYQQDDESKVTNKQRDILSYILHSCLLAAKIKGAKVITVPGQVMHIQ